MTFATIIAANQGRQLRSALSSSTAASLAVLITVPSVIVKVSLAQWTVLVEPTTEITLNKYNRGIVRFHW